MSSVLEISPDPRRDGKAGHEGRSSASPGNPHIRYPGFQQGLRAVPLLPSTVGKPGNATLYGRSIELCSPSLRGEADDQYGGDSAG